MEGRAHGLLVLVAGATLLALVIAPWPWLPHPLFTPLPWFGDVDLGLGPSLVVLAALIGLLLSLPFATQPRPLLIAFCALFLLRSSWDRVTWQPYFFQYFLILLALGSSPARKALDIARLVYVATYFWAGVSKLNRTFIGQGIELIFHPIAGWFPVEWLARGGVMVPLIEVVAGPLLLFRRTRLAGVAVICCMHGLILLDIGPLGANDQQVVWPWNLASMVGVWLLFGPRAQFRAVAVVNPGRNVAHLLTWALFVVGPGLSYVVPWDPYLAMRVYSYRTHEAFVDMAPTVLERLPEESQAIATKLATTDGYAYRVRLVDWVHEELGAFPSPVPSSFHRIGRRLCQHATDPRAVVLTILDPPHWRTGKMEHRSFYCDEL